MNELINNQNYEYEEVTYDNEMDMQHDMEMRKKNGWEAASTDSIGGSGVSGGCIGCIGFIPIIIPFPGSRAKYKITYRRAK